MMGCSINAQSKRQTMTNWKGVDFEGDPIVVVDLRDYVHGEPDTGGAPAGPAIMAASFHRVDRHAFSQPPS